MRRAFFLQKAFFFLICLIAFSIPVEHKYDKLFRFYSLTLIPEGIFLPKEFDKNIYFYPSDFLALFLFAMAILVFKIRLKQLLFEKGAPFLFFIFLCALASIVASPLIAYPVVYTRLLQLLSPILLYTLVANLFSEKSREKWVTGIFFSLFFAALLQAGIAILQYFTQAPLGLRLLGEVPQAMGKFRSPHGYRWIFDRILDCSFSSETLLRASGTFPNTNILGGFLAVSLLASYPFFFSQERKSYRKFFSLAIFIQFFAMVITFSRAALLGWFVGTLFWMFFCIQKGDVCKTSKRKMFRYLISTLAFSLVATGILCGEQIVHRGGIFQHNHLSRLSNANRIIYQNKSLELIQKHPLFGVGFQQYSYRADPHTFISAPHNIYLFLAAEIGLFALFSFLGLIVYLLYSLFTMDFSPEAASLGAIFIACLFIGFCDFYLLLSHQGTVTFFLSMALLASYKRRSISTESPIVIT